MTVAEALKIGVSRLKDRDQAQLESELLLAHSLGWSREELFVNSAEVLDEGDSLVYDSYLSRLVDGEPVAYITNFKSFYAYDFFVDKRVLIPRPETEILVGASLEFIKQNARQAPLRVLDLCTGSGCIAISVVKSLVDEGFDLLDEVLAVDISDEALEVAKLNAAQQGVDHLIRFVQSDLFEFADFGEEFDLIVTNPPYVGKVENAHVAADVRKYEPEMALFAGDDGFDIYKRMFDEMEAKQIMFNSMFGEFGMGQGIGMRDLLSENFSGSIEIKKDLAGIDRIFTLSNN